MKASEYFELAQSVEELTSQINQNLEIIAKAGGAFLVKLRDYKSHGAQGVYLDDWQFTGPGFSTDSSEQSRKVFTLSLCSARPYSAECVRLFCDTLQTCNSFLDKVYETTEGKCVRHVQLTTSLKENIESIKFSVSTEGSLYHSL